MRGRKPKPTWLKLIAGNPGKRATNDNEPEPVGALIDPPEWMSEAQKQGWRYAIEHAPPGLLRRLDRSVFTVWVVAEDLHRDAALKVAQYGVLIKAPHTGVLMQSPYVAVLNKQASIMLKAAAELGFSPSSRSRVQVAKPSESANRFADLRDATD